ncbi:MAG: hypothetical protein LBJ61_12555 [Deltaproteobacteria bacterium]|jgi:hypothetical protein|nr:hypothetical protein [Deltaproteobacteria bacterium]
MKNISYDLPDNFFDDHFDNLKLNNIKKKVPDTNENKLLCMKLFPELVNNDQPLFDSAQIKRKADPLISYLFSKFLRDFSSSPDTARFYSVENANSTYQYLVQLFAKMSVENNIPILNYEIEKYIEENM